MVVNDRLELLLMASVNFDENQMFASRTSLRSLFVAFFVLQMMEVHLEKMGNIMSRSLYDFSKVISDSNCVVQYVLKVPRGMTAIDIPGAMNPFGLPGIEISVV